MDNILYSNSTPPVYPLLQALLFSDLYRILLCGSSLQSTLVVSFHQALLHQTLRLRVPSLAGCRLQTHKPCHATRSRRRLLVSSAFRVCSTQIQRPIVSPWPPWSFRSQIGFFSGTQQHIILILARGVSRTTGHLNPSFCTLSNPQLVRTLSHCK